MVFENLSKYLLELNTLNEYIHALLFFLVLFFVFLLFDYYVIKFLKKGSRKTKTTWDDMIIDFVDGINWIFYLFLSIYLSFKTLALPNLLEKSFYYLFLILIVFYASKGSINIFVHALDRYAEKKRKSDKHVGESMISVLKFISKIIIIIVAFLMILSNLGIEITPLIAGFGIGGIAIGIALQGVLGDLFSAFAIYFDKPFEEGDFIIIGEDMGVVKHIGIKTTRIQALGGQELVLSNSDLTSARVNNYKRMDTRRVVFNFGVEYDTPVNKLKKTKKIVEEVIKKEKHAKLDRVHFKKFGDFSLDFEVVYYVDSSDYNTYMDVQERINLNIKEKIEKEGVNFAFPTQTILLDK
jgi:small-conductance mechanosensitive channel